jgi:NAD(P)H-flavin reductase
MMSDYHADYHDPFDSPMKTKSKRSFRLGLKFLFFFFFFPLFSRRLHYETIFWTIFGLLTVWSILDRFLVNLYPMGINFKPLAGTCYIYGTVCINTLQSKGVTIPWSVMAFDGWGRATGRLFLTVFGALFWTQCKSTENFLMEHHPSWINLGDLRTIHNRTHYILGMFFMGIPMIIHLTITFLPAMTGVPLHVNAARVANKVSPFIAPNPATGVAEIFLTFDDIYRTVLSLTLFVLVFPFSISNFARKRWFSLTQWLHIAGAALFSIDMIRRSPHSQVFNTPVVFYFLVDRIFGLWFYRTGVASIIHKEVLDEEYIILFLYVPRQKRRRGTGSGYYIQFVGLEGAFEIAHPYISFQNHSGDPMIPEWRNRDHSSSDHKFYVDRSAGERKAFARRKSISKSPNELEAEFEEMDRRLENEDGIAQETEDVIFFSNWNTALFVQIHKWNRGENSFSSRLLKKQLGQRIRFWGPYTSEYSQITPKGQYLPPLVLIATGSGAGPIIDFYLYFTTNKVDLINPVTVYFSTQSIGLFQFTTDLVCSKAINNWTVNAHLTSSSEYDVDDDIKGTHDTHSSTRDMKLGRLSFMEVLSGAPGNSKVFFCGAPALQWLVQVAAKTYNLEYYPGHRFSSDGTLGCQRVGKCRFTCICTRFPVCCTY